MAKTPQKKPRLTKAKREAIAAIKAKGYSASYEKRLLRGVQQGKSRQATRGHKPKEHIERREKERVANFGLTIPQVKNIIAFHSEFDPRGQKGEATPPGPRPDQMIEFAQMRGYKAFVAYRTKWRSIHKQYLGQLRRKTHEQQTTSFMNEAMAEIEAEYSGDFKIDEGFSWLYYH